MVTVIVSYYKSIDNLKLILKAFATQSVNQFEVILSEDDNNQETRTFIAEQKDYYDFSINHIYQKEDNGFRKNMMLNRAIVQAKSDLLVFIDGDCIPHRHFIKEYIKHDQPKSILTGRRVMLGEKISEKLLKHEDLKELRFHRLMFSDSGKVKEGIYSPFFSLSNGVRDVCGCNWGVRKEYLLDINGFDESYQSAGVGEDNDIEWRLLESGLKRKSMKNKAIVYHVYHERSYSESKVAKNFELFRERQKQGNIRCLKGIQKI